MSDSCTSRTMCEVWRPPPLPYITGEDKLKLKTIYEIYATDEAYKNYTSCCPGYGYVDGPDISGSTTASAISREVVTPTVTVFFKTQEVASAGLSGGYIALIVIVLSLMLFICIAVFIRWKYYNNRQSSWAQRCTKYNTINCLDYKACKFSCWRRTNTPLSPNKTDIKQNKSDGVKGQKEEIDIKKLYILEVQINVGKKGNEFATTVEKNQSHRRNGSIESKRASENGGEKVTEDTVSENGGKKVTEDTVSEKGGEKVTEGNASENGVGKVREYNATENGGEMARVVIEFMNREKCNKDERTLTPVENVNQDEIDEIQHKGDHKSANDDILRHSQGINPRNPPYLPSLDS